MGTPTKYTPEYCEKAREVCKEGMTNQQLADALGVGKTTVDRWLVKYPEFKAAVEAGRGVADRKVEFALFQKAIGGYSYTEKKEHRDKKGEITRTEVTHKHLAPDTLAMIFWLKNRCPEVWRDRKELDLQTPKTEMSDEQRASKIMELIERVRIQAAYDKGITAVPSKGNNHGTETKIN